MKIEIEEKENQLYVTVTISLPSVGRAREKVVLNDIQKILQERKIKYGRCLKTTKITNRSVEQCSGTFIFEIPPKVSRPKSKPVHTPISPKPKNRKKTTKTA